MTQQSGRLVGNPPKKRPHYLRVTFGKILKQDVEEACLLATVVTGWAVAHWIALVS